MVLPTWTEKWSSFAPAGTGWQNYDIFTNLSVPKGAIAHIIMTHSNTGALRTLGVRKDGSSLSRYCIINKAGTGGVSAVDMYVKVDSSTGLIETYCDSTSGVTFYCTGYWTGTDYTELYTDITGTLTGWAWDSRNIFTNQSIPKGSVCSIVCLNQANATHVGVRTSGSALARYTMLSTCSGGSNSGEAMSYQVKSNVTTGAIEIFMGNTATLLFYIAGYFAPSMDYTELEMIESWANNEWYDFDVSSYLDQNERVIDAVASHYDTSAAHTVGVRNSGSSLSRYISLKPSPDAYVFMSAPTATNASGLMQMYNSPIGNGFHFTSGYYIPIDTPVENPITPFSFCVFVG